MPTQSSGIQVLQDASPPIPQSGLAFYMTWTHVHSQEGSAARESFPNEVAELEDWAQGSWRSQVDSWVFSDIHLSIMEECRAGAR